MNPGIPAHLKETTQIVLEGAAETILPPAVLSLCVLALAASHPAPPSLEGLTLPAWLTAGLAAAAASYGAFSALLHLMEQMEVRGILREVLAAPLGGGGLALAWLLPSTLAGFAAGLVVLGLGGRITGLETTLPPLAPLLLSAAFFAGLALPAWLFLPQNWGTPFRLYILPLLVLGGALAPAEAWSSTARGLLLLDPAYQGAAALRGFLSPATRGIQPVWLLGILLALSAGFWSFSLDLCRRGLGLRTR